MFWGAIAWNWKGPCVVIKKESKTERLASLAQLESDAILKWRDAMESFTVKACNYYIVKG
jgi:hypothetical protein